MLSRKKGTDGGRRWSLPPCHPLESPPRFLVYFLSWSLLYSSHSVSIILESLTRRNDPFQVQARLHHVRPIVQGSVVVLYQDVASCGVRTQGRSGSSKKKRQTATTATITTRLVKVFFFYLCFFSFYLISTGRGLVVIFFHIHTYCKGGRKKKKKRQVTNQRSYFIAVS